MGDKPYKSDSCGNVLCILHGLPRTVRVALPIFMRHVVNSKANTAKNWFFYFVVHSEGITTDLKEFFCSTLNDAERRCQLKEIYEVVADPLIIKNSNDAYYFRLYDSLRREEMKGNKYDMYINCRLDAVPTTDVPLELFEDNITIIGGESLRPCIYHHRDWDFMTIGNYFSYKLYHYLAINTAFLDWNNLSSRPNDWPKLYTADFDGTNNGWADGLHPGASVTPEDHLKLEEITGMRSDKQMLLFDNIISNVIKRGGRFFFSDANSQIYSKLIRQGDFSKAYL